MSHDARAREPDCTGERAVDPVKMYLFDVDGNDPTPDDWNVTDIPAYRHSCCYAEGKEIDRHTWLVPLPRIRDWLNASLR